jgi:hypothetical protein
MQESGHVAIIVAGHFQLLVHFNLLNFCTCALNGGCGDMWSSKMLWSRAWQCLILVAAVECDVGAFLVQHVLGKNMQSDHCLLWCWVDLSFCPSPTPNPRLHSAYILAPHHRHLLYLSVSKELDLREKHTFQLANPSGYIY